jgi:hypothetical protein
LRVEFDEKEVRDVLSRILDKIADSLIEKMKENIVQMDAVATGMLIKSFEKKKEEDAVVVENTAPYAYLVEFGTEPHDVPFEPILRWVIIKKGESLEDAVESAWRIVAKIKREGTEEKPFVRNAIHQLVSESE